MPTPEGGAWNGLAISTHPEGARHMASPFGTRPRVQLTSAGLTLVTDPTERPRLWHWGRARLRHPNAATGAIKEVGRIAALVRAGDALELALSASAQLTITLRRDAQLMFAAGDAWGIGATGVAELDGWLSQSTDMHPTATAWTSVGTFAARTLQEDAASFAPRTVYFISATDAAFRPMFEDVLEPMARASLATTPF